MNTIRIDGKEHPWRLPKPIKRRNASAFHINIREFLFEVFPFDPILEEVRIPKIKLYIDFLLPARKLAFECNGRQHYEYIQHFFPTRMDFLQAQKRDRQKIQILEENGITVVSLKWDEPKLWKQQIQQSKH